MRKTRISSAEGATYKRAQCVGGRREKAMRAHIQSEGWGDEKVARMCV